MDDALALVTMIVKTVDEDIQWHGLDRLLDLIKRGQEKTRVIEMQLLIWVFILAHPNDQTAQYRVQRPCLPF